MLISIIPCERQSTPRLNYAAIIHSSLRSKTNFGSGETPAIKYEEGAFQSKVGSKTKAPGSDGIGSVVTPALPMAVMYPNETNENL